MVVEAKKADPINGKDPVSWYQLLTLGRRGVWDDRSDEYTIQPQRSVLERDSGGQTATEYIYMSSYSSTKALKLCFKCSENSRSTTLCTV